MKSATRRVFLMDTLALGASMALASPLLGKVGSMEKKNLLILGGTSFLGPAIVHAALGRNHEVTLFNRGMTGADLFPDLETIIGNRDPNIEPGLSGLKGRSFDMVIDTSGYVPWMVRESAQALRDHVEHYVFISSISVYPTYSEIGMTESAETARIPEEAMARYESLTFADGYSPRLYGALKAGCEREAEKAMPGRVSNIRPGLIVGPRDRTNRFTYWPVRVEKGGEVLAPGTPSDPVQYIDVRDLAEFCLAAAEKRAAGLFNATGPVGGMEMGHFLNACKEVTDSDANFVWADADFLTSQGVSAWQNMPMWVPPSGDYAGFGRISVDRAIKAGLSFRPVADTIKTTLNWYHNDAPEKVRASLKAGKSAGLSAEREAEVLAALKERE